MTQRIRNEVWGSFFEKFDPTAAVEKYFNKWAESPNSKYFSTITDGRSTGFTDDEIKDQIVSSWARKGQEASRQGACERQR